MMWRTVLFAGAGSMLNPRELKLRLLSGGLARPNDIVGCSEEEIDFLEQKEGVKLPKSYRRFLRLAGRNAGQFMGDLTIFYPDVIGLTDRTRQDGFELPQRAFVFMDRMGEVFFYFVCDGNDDPPIYGWAEGTERIEKVYESLWAFLESELIHHEEIAD